METGLQAFKWCGHQEGEGVTEICLLKNSGLISFPANSLFNMHFRMGGVQVLRINRQLCLCRQNKSDYNLDVILHLAVLCQVY